MKPYTLPWWINILHRCYTRAFYAKNPEAMVHYDLLAIWVENRIIKKYGEQ